MKKWILFLIVLVGALAIPTNAKSPKWVDFDVPYESLKYAMDVDIDTFEREHHISWIDILALAGARTGGKCHISSVKKAVEDLNKYYHNVYSAVLGGLLGSYAIEIDGVLKPQYGLKAYSPIAAGYGYSHCSDFGNRRSFGFARRHLGNDLMGALGTPVVAVESGVVEALGWNSYGGWRIGIRSVDSKRYYYYAHLQKDRPFQTGLNEGDIVQAGDVIGFMGRTGYSDKENTNNIQTVHLHFGMELVFEEWQKECNNEIWIDVYNIVRLLNNHRSSLQKTEQGFQRVYPFHDLDVGEYPCLGTH